MPKIRRVLIFTKRSAYQAYFHEYQGRPMKLLMQSGDKGLLHIRRTHRAHYDTLRHVKSALKVRGVSFDVRFRGQKFDASAYDLVIAVGGDGTFLEAAQGLTRQMILGINSDKNHSVGNFSVSDRVDFESDMDRLMKGDFCVRKINRLRCILDGRQVPFLALNEVLVCHASPAAMSHYVLRVGTVSERQRSSGVWISTAAGSTGAMRSAGGRVIALSSKMIQYLPRELYDGHGVRYKLKGGLLAPGRSVTITSQMQEGTIYLDGSHRALAFAYGRRLKICNGSPLKIVHFDS